MTQELTYTEVNGYLIPDLALPNDGLPPQTARACIAFLLHLFVATGLENDLLRKYLSFYAKTIRAYGTASIALYFQFPVHNLKEFAAFLITERGKTV